MDEPAAAPAAALTVHLALGGPQAAAIVRFVERDLGWNAVDEAGGATLTVTDGHVDAPPPGGPPVVLLVCDERTPAAAAADVLRCRAAAVVAWPRERARLATEAQQLARVALPMRTAVDLRVGGAAGGVGTTTVALALGGWFAWARRRVLVLACGPVPGPAGGPAAPQDLLATTTWSAAAPARGLPGLRVLATTASAGEVPVDAGPADVVLRDLGVATEVDVLVARGDAAGLDAASATTAGAIVVVGGGLVPVDRLRAAGGGRAVVMVPWSARVARAALAGRVPSGLPGRWLQTLRPLVVTVIHSSGGTDRDTARDAL